MKKNKCKRFVAFFDIMGFENYVLHNSHTAVTKRMNLLSRTINEIKNLKQATVQTVIFSDSIMLVSQDNSKNSAREVLILASLFLAKCMRDNIPIKGAISYGTFTADFKKSLYFGQPLIDAYKLQDELYLFGCILHHTFEAFLKDNDYFDYHKNNVFLYETPIKNGIVKHYLINWIDPIESIHKIGDKKPTVLIEDFYKSVSGITRKYVDNTIDYVKFQEDNKIILFEAINN